jgi:predicted dehydrogenase
MARVHDVLGWNSLIIRGTSAVVRGDDAPRDAILAGERLRAERIAEVIGDSSPALASAYGLLLGLCTHDISAMRGLLGMPHQVLYAAQRYGGLCLSAAFDYGSFICHFEAAVDNIPRFDAHLEVYGEERVLRVQYDTPYVRNLPIRLLITGSNGSGGVVERAEHPAWGDPFVDEWLAFYENVCSQSEPKTSAADARQDLVLLQDMIRLMN